jgi:hypothetical protein
MAIIRAQYKTAADADGAAQSTLSTFLRGPTNAHSFFEWASVTDNKDFYNISTLAYWSSKATYEAWAEQSGSREWWQGLNPENCRHGWFLEIFFPTMNRLETHFNTNETPESYTHMREGMSRAVEEYGYWGSMRDHIPAS